MKQVLVTGGAGYIGSHTVHYLLSQGFKPEQIIVFDNLVYGHEEHLPEGIIFVKGDLLNKEELDLVFEQNNIDSVIHFAAYAYVGESMSNPGKYFENNFTGGLNLLQLMVKYNCKKIVFSSTCATYGMPKLVPIKEDETQNPINPYGESKLMFESALDWFDKIYGLKSVALRYFNAAGAGFGIGEKHDPETHMIPLTFDAAYGRRDSIKIFGTDYDTPDGTCIRDYIHVIDLADAHLRALNYLTKNAESLRVNLGTGKGTSVREIIDLVKESTKIEFKVEEESRREGDPAELIANPSLAAEVLGWKAKYNIKDIISDVNQWEIQKNEN